MVEVMIKKQRNDRIQVIEQLDRQVSIQPKSSSELLNIIQIKKWLLKLKEYGEGHKIQQRINNLTKQEAENWDEERKKLTSN